MAQPSDPRTPADALPDIMNDPQFVTNTADGEDGMGDVDTCRICRGEGGATEPLFHPCKCSGSIKYVHQDCLMEWLSHSQKKHCELCKTPFRFTKLYSPNMPPTLPLPVLLRHVIIHTVKNLTTWLRLCLVIAVWLGFLPYIIRQVWRLLFWFSDGGWPPNYLLIDPTRNSTAIRSFEIPQELKLAAMADYGTSPVTPFQSSQTSSASMGGMIDRLVGFLMPISQTLNISSTDPLAAGLFKSLYYGFGIQNVNMPEGPVNNISASQYLNNISPSSKSSSLLSEVSFLQNLTRSTYFNQLVITVAEGYVITILVVICFILVFLIREWVVQQQPGINMGAGFNAEFAAPERPREQLAVPEPREEEAARLPVGVNPMDHLQEPREIGLRPIARPRRRNPHFGDINDYVIREAPEPGPDDETPPDAGGSLNRPVPVRDALLPAAEIQRALTEDPGEPRMTEEFLAIWRRADGDPQEVLRIIETENAGDQMRYWVNAMKILQNPLSQKRELHVPTTPSPHQSSKSNVESSPGDPFIPAPPLDSQDGITERRTGQTENESCASSESWENISHPRSSHEQNLLPDENQVEIDSERNVALLDKGKNPAREQRQEPVRSTVTDPTEKLLSEGFDQNHDSYSNIPAKFNPDWTPLPPDSLSMHRIQPLSASSASTSSRPRSLSDGPQLRETISPLAKNNWSFSNIPDSDDKVDSISSRAEENRKSSQDPNMIAGSSGSLIQPISSEIHVPGSQAWKVAQDIRVQQAITKGREAHKTALEYHEPIMPPVHDPENEDPAEVRLLDSSLQTYQNWEEAFEAHPADDSEDEDAAEGVDHPEINPFRPDTPIPEPREPIVARPIEPRGFVGTITDFLWGGVGDHIFQDEQAANDEHIVQDIAAEAPFVPVAHHDPLEQGLEFPQQDREVVEAANAAGLDPNDPDGIDDAEDFEGIMELVGMRGPVFSLVQNALFSAFLLALTVAFGVWIPYNIGRISLLLLANPGPAFKLPLKLVFGFAAFMQDLALSLVGLVSYCLIAILSLPMNLWSYYSATANTAITINGMEVGSTALNLSHHALERVLDGTVSSFAHITDSEIFAFSAASHESLISLKTLIVNVISGIGRIGVFIFIGDYSLSMRNLWGISTTAAKHGWQLFSVLPAFLTRPDTWVISLEVEKRVTPLNLELSVWDGMDRFWATLAGYTALCLLGALYVRKGTPFSTGQVGREWEATIIDLLNQAGGVMKVILIISIEMLVFPLYCGLLLDAALLPLFENTTIMSRVQFTFKSPLTSIFVHWFVGTCYMFHFALFVSMCRKIMRKGVLYFIRDPDDPTFHPVRDVLERNVATQLRKILFSALVYGGLVVICLGGVVWGLSFAFKGVLPIHWSSNEPVLEFPIDLLFYNFLMPLAVKFFKPSDGLHAMYSWWFRQCARMLRLTWFMFDERKKDEEGYTVRRDWKDIFRGARDGEMKVIKTEDIQQPFQEDPELQAYFRQDGRYVRAPASDQVRIPKGTGIFLEVDESNSRIDGKRDRLDGVHGKNSELFKQVYIPPWFRTRIFLFIVFIWLFAALTGVCITIVPLVFGRQVFARMIPPHVRKNDVYAFSIGIYILGSALYAIAHLGKFISYLRRTLAINAETPQNVLRRLSIVASRIARIAWTYAAFLFILPTMFAFVVEFYFIVPLHTYFAFQERHVVHFVQSWTLGLLYVKLTTRLILWHEDSRPAQSLRAITRNGYLNPDAWLATRSFILPATVVLSAALFYPWLVAQVATMTFLKNNPDKHLLTYRYSYPMCLCFLCIVFTTYTLLGWVKDWRMKIRDEVYLIGERLHNFGDRKGGSNGVAVPNMRRIQT